MFGILGIFGHWQPVQIGTSNRETTTQSGRGWQKTDFLAHALGGHALRLPHMCLIATSSAEKRKEKKRRKGKK